MVDSELSAEWTTATASWLARTPRFADVIGLDVECDLRRTGAACVRQRSTRGVEPAKIDKFDVGSPPCLPPNFGRKSRPREKEPFR